MGGPGLVKALCKQLAKGPGYIYVDSGGNVSCDHSLIFT